jgi:hypothetical protein
LVSEGGFIDYPASPRSTGSSNETHETPVTSATGIDVFVRQNIVWSIASTTQMLETIRLEKFDYHRKIMRKASKLGEAAK